MKILVLCKRPPYPLTDGESLRILNYGRHLTRTHTLDLICLADGPVPEPVNEVFTRVETFRTPSERRGRGLARLRESFHIDAFAAQYPQVENHLRAVLPQRDYDVIWTSADMISSIPDDGSAKCVLADICDDNVLLLRRELTRTRNPIRSLRVLKRLLVARQFEKRYYSSAAACLFVSEDDAASYRALAPESRIAVIANGVDAEYFAPTNGTSEPATIVFEGSMDFQPNTDAAVYLCREILPRVLRRRADARVILVGRDPTPEVKALASDRVTVTGYVDDVRPYLSAATVFVCPLRMGAGVKNKLLQAWSMGKAVVATPLSLGGLLFEDGRNILVRERPADLAGGVVTLLEDSALRARLGAHARETINAAYTWHAKSKQLEELMASITQRCRQGYSDA